MAQDDHCRCGTTANGRRVPNPWCVIPTHSTEQPRMPGPNDPFTDSTDAEDD